MWKPPTPHQIALAKLITAESNRADNLKHELATQRASLADYLYAGSAPVADAQSERAGEAPEKPQ